MVSGEEGDEDTRVNRDGEGLSKGQEILRKFREGEQSQRKVWKMRPVRRKANGSWSVMSKENTHKGDIITCKHTGGTYKAASNQFSNNGPDF